MSSSAARPSPPVPSETRAIALIAGVQFVNVLDFMMVMPLGPDFARALGIPLSHIGLVGGSYNAAAAVAGVLGSFFLDRFDRRTALSSALFGLAIGTYLGGLSIGFSSLLAARVVAGAFGGPATALSIASLADIVPPERRGQAMGRVMGAFAVASVFGVPVGLELARHLGFRAPFFVVGSLCLAASFLARRLLPSLRAHLDSPASEQAGSILEPTILLSLTASGLVMAGNFALIPFLSAFLQFNLGYPRAKLPFVYAIGGVASWVTMQIVGKLVDRFGSARLVLVGTAVYLTVLTSTFLVPILVAIPLLTFPAFMTSNAMRFVPMQSLSSRVPTADRRARFLSTQSAVQHLASSIGSMSASAFLVALPSGRLVGLDRVAMVSVCLASVVPLIAFAVEWRVRNREADERSARDHLARQAAAEESLVL